jgi:hypothetical protein
MELLHIVTYHAERLLIFRLFKNAVSTAWVIDHRMGWEDRHEFRVCKDLKGDTLVLFDGTSPSFVWDKGKVVPVLN